MPRATTVQARGPVQSLSVYAWWMLGEAWGKYQLRDQEQTFQKRALLPFQIIIICKSHIFWGEVFSLLKCLCQEKACQEMGFH